MSEDDRSMLVRGEPNKEFYKKAKEKYKSFNDSARTEYQRLLAVNNKHTLMAFINPAEHAIFYHLSQLRLAGTFQ
jgi:hypothetical protein